jgi:ATP-dependent helicase HrpB
VELVASHEPSQSTPAITIITELGRKMLAFPVHPRYARMLLAAQDFGCVHQACLIAALTQGRDLLLRNPGRDVLAFREDLFGAQASSDFWLWMRAYSYAAKSNFNFDACRRAGVHALTARQVGPLLDQFLRIARDEGLEATPRRVPDEALEKCILLGFSDRVARRLDAGTLRCDLVHGRRATLARESAVHNAPLLVAAEIREIEGADKTANTLLSLATAIRAEWLRELFPADLATATHVEYDATTRRVEAQQQLRFRDLLIESKRLDPPPLDQAASLLAAEIFAGRLALPRWDHAIDQWILRLNLLARWCPDLGLPPLTDPDRRHILERLCEGAFSYREIKDRDVLPAVLDWLSPAQQQLLERHAPQRLRLANGREPRLTYSADSAPFISLRIQELFDVQTLPRIALGRTAVVAHILAPNMRPVQITQDLEGFWRDHYPRLKSELQRKYPKHQWR